MTYYETIMAIGAIKKDFEKEIEKKLKLTKVQSPLFVKRESGLQDDLSGVEKAVTFDKDDEQFEIVHSLAKWKRSALGKYGFPVYTGLYTDMKAIRKDEIVDATHSLYVEQWDWEQVIEEKDRNIAYLKKTVNKIYSAIRNTSLKLSKKYPELDLGLPEKIFFITSQKLEDLYPYYSPEEREDLITKEKRAVFIIGIGDKLKSGIIAEDISLPALSSEQKTEVFCAFNNCDTMEVGSYNCFLVFNVDGLNYGEPITIMVNVIPSKNVSQIETNVNSFRKLYAFDMSYSDDDLTKALVKNNNDFEKAYEYLLTQIIH